MGEPLFTPIAVIGMACRLPGGINSPELLWEALLRGDDLVTEIPGERWNADEYLGARIAARSPVEPHRRNSSATTNARRYTCAQVTVSG